MSDIIGYLFYSRDYIKKFDKNILDKNLQYKWLNATVEIPAEETAFQWVIKNIKYESDMTAHNQIEYFSPAEETLKKRRGDCEDLAILLYALLYPTYPNGYVVIGNVKEGGHSWVEIDDTVLDPANKIIMNKKEYYKKFKAEKILWFNMKEHHHKW